MDQPTVGTDVAPSVPEPGSREAFLAKLGAKGIKSLGDFHPAAESIRARAAAEAPAPQVPDAPAADAGVSPVRQDRSEVDALRLELAELRGRLSATQKPAEVVEEKPKVKPLDDPFMVAAKAQIGDDAPEYLLTEAAQLVDRMRLFNHNLRIDPENAEAKKALPALERRLVEIERLAAKDREVRELRTRLDRLENPVKGIAADVATILPQIFTDEGFAKHNPRLAHALKSGAITKAKIEARLQGIDAESMESWADKADAALRDLDDLFPDPPAAPAVTTANPRSAPANPAASAPRAAGGQSATREPAKTRAESRQRLRDRLRARG